MTMPASAVMTAISSKSPAGFFECRDDFLERRTGFLLQCADDEDADDRDHAGFAGFPVLDHQGVNENRQRNQKHPAAADHAAKFRDLLFRQSYQAALGGFQIDLREQGKIVKTTPGSTRPGRFVRREYLETRP